MSLQIKWTTHPPNFQNQIWELTHREPYKKKIHLPSNYAVHMASTLGTHLLLLCTSYIYIYIKKKPITKLTPTFFLQTKENFNNWNKKKESKKITNQCINYDKLDALYVLSTFDCDAIKHSIQIITYSYYSSYRLKFSMWKRTLSCSLPKTTTEKKTCQGEKKLYHLAGSVRGLYFPYRRFQSICSLHLWQTPVISDKGFSLPPTSYFEMISGFS